MVRRWACTESDTRRRIPEECRSRDRYPGADRDHRARRRETRRDAHPLQVDRRLVFVCGMFMDIMDTTIVNVATPDARTRVPRVHRGDRVGRPRLPPVARDLDPGVGLDRRPHRHQEGVPVRARDVHDRVGAVRAGAQPGRARRVPGAAGRRRRDARRRSAPRCCSARSRRSSGPRRRPSSSSRPCSRRRSARSSAAGSSPTCRGAGSSTSTCRSAIFGFVIGALFLREHREGTAGRFDARRASSSRAPGSRSVLYALSEGPEKGWTFAAGPRRPASSGSSCSGCWSTSRRTSA